MGSEKDARESARRRSVAVPSLRKAMSILDLVGRRGQLHFSVIQKALDLPKSTTHQLLKALTEIGALQGLRDGSFMLGPKLWELGALSLRQRTIDKVSLRYLDLLSRETGLPCIIGTLEGCNVVGMAVARPNDRAKTIGNDVVRLPAHRTAIGKALLAHLDELDRRRLIDDFDWAMKTPTSIPTPGAMMAELVLVKERGWAFDDCENDRTSRCIAAPVFDARQRAIAAIATVGEPHEITPDRYDALSELVRSAAQAVTADYIASC
jgi:DNA-binding IclR family transcriptional regulator